MKKIMTILGIVLFLISTAPQTHAAKCNDLSLNINLIENTIMQPGDTIHVHTDLGTTDLGNKNYQFMFYDLEGDWIGIGGEFKLNPQQANYNILIPNQLSSDQTLNLKIISPEGNDFCDASNTISVKLGHGETSPTPVFTVKSPCPDNICETAIGKIDTSSPTAFIETFIKIIFSIISIVGLSMLIYSGYLILLSRGDKEKISQGKEILISTITGIIFLIFSFTILEIIGVEILQIPGFTR